MATNKVDLGRWKPHLEAAKREGQTIARYARSRGLSRHTLYAASQQLGAEGGVNAGRPARRHRSAQPALSSAFAPVQWPSPVLVAAGTRLEAQWANGAKLAIETNDPARELLAVALKMLSRRR
jgi:hypothetical protein